MRPYELMFIVDPDVENEEVQRLANNVKALITNQGGEVTEDRLMGKRKLAYRIKHKAEGQYILINFRGTPALLTELKRELLHNERVLKHLLLRPEIPKEAVPQEEEEKQHD